ncbi:MAG: RdgB/HAM1 family non-canonical purine NTP pyrophosphatase [Verrucomicrobiales bacterium]|nr:RdgB/HAM1 family non-canonical purine NTP pyrophosphatase [Verrucomicrobiales bacterium]
MRTLVLATRNRHKVGEIQAVLGPAFEYLTLADLPAAPEVEEDAGTFAGNARKKAETLAGWLAANGSALAGREIWVLADDSGLEVDALDGAPGVHSARFAAFDTGRPGNSTDAENNQKLLRRLDGVPASDRTARFRCVMALTPVPAAGAAPSVTQLFTGVCEGSVLDQPRGTGGFGYDPLFLPQGFELSFAELGEEAKNRISHRARALAGLHDWLAAHP